MVNEDLPSKTAKPSSQRSSRDPAPSAWRIGHALAQREHNGDRWIAATAIRIGVPLVSNDKIFRDVPGLALEALDAD